MPESNTKKRRWLRWVIAALCLVFLAGVGGWLFATGFVRQTIEAQLTDLGLGKPTIGNIVISSNGISARNIEFAEAASGATLKLDSLKIIHPISGLVAGDDVYDRIELAGLEAVVDLDKLPAQTEPISFDLTAVKLPAKTLKLTDSNVIIRQADRTDFKITAMDMLAESVDDSIRVTGNIDQMADGAWTVNGSLQTNEGKWNAKLTTDSAKLKDGTWQTWPMLPESMSEYLEAQADVGATVSVVGDSETPFSYQAEAVVNDGRLRIPAFDLPVIVKAANLTAKDGVVRYKNLIATIDGQDQLTSSGSTTIAGFPLATAFNVDFQDFDVATIRKFAEAIPATVTGRATGTASGTVNVESSLRTTFALNGTGRSDSGFYGKIQSNDLTTTVAIEPLILDSQLNLESLAGSVVVEAKASDLPAADIFESLELQDLGKQLQIDVLGSGDVRLELPLATAEKLETWAMKINASAPEGTVSGQPVHNVRIKANLQDGNLNFTQITASADTEQTSSLNLSIDWPLTENGNHPDLGALSASGRQVPAHWLIALAQQQITNASGGDQPLEPANAQSTFAATLTEIAGGINFDSQLAIPTASPDSIESWDVNGTVSDSLVAVGNYQLRDLNSSISLSDGQLSVAKARGLFEASGRFDGGELSGNATMNLVTGEIESAAVVGDEVPLKWLASVGSEFSPELRSFLTDNGLANLSEPDPLEGEVSLTFNLKDSGDPRFEDDLLADDAKGVDSDWVISTRISSNELRVKSQVLGNLLIEGEFDSREIKIQNARADLPNQGKFGLGGNWLINEQSGQADLAWQRIPISWLASFRGPNLEMLEGTTNGEIRLTKTNIAAANGDAALSISVSGSATATAVAIAGFKTQELGFDIRTVGDKLMVEKFRADGDFRGINLNGNLKLAEPFEFALNGVVSSLPLSRILAKPSVTEKIGETKYVTGVASGNIDLVGSLSSLNWVTSGNLAIAEPRINGQRLSDIEAKWTYSGNDWAASKVVIDAFGGKIELKELVASPSRIKVDLSGIDAKELNSLTVLPVKFKGKLTGDASLNEWSLAETRWVDLNLKAASASVGAAEFGDFTGNAEIRNQKLSYSLDGRLLNGKLTSQGEVDLSTAVETGFQNTSFPLEVQLTNGSLNDLYKRSPALSSLRPMLGSVSAKADVVLWLDKAPTGKGTITVNDLTWNNELLTREISTDVDVREGRLQFVNLRADLKRGEISGRATIPLAANTTGSYQLDMRQFDLQRFLDVVISNPVKGVGMLDAQISGQIGRSINGQGSLAVNRAKILGLTGRTFRIPVRFQIEPTQQSGRVEFPEASFQLFGGNVSGHSTLDFGRVLNFNTDLKISMLDTEQMFSSLAGLDESGQGDLSGRLVVTGNSIRSLRDLRGSFTGELDRAEAFELPLLDTVARFLGGNQLQSSNFESDDIALRLNAGKLEVKRLNLSNSLAQIAITGSAFVDGRLDLDVIGRVERINQPTLIQELAGSPLARFQGSPVALFAQAADFLSDRLVFVKIGGTFARPQVRANTGKQLQQETIRYFLRDSQILPNADDQNN